LVDRSPGLVILGRVAAWVLLTALLLTVLKHFTGSARAGMAATLLLGLAGWLWLIQCLRPVPEG